MYGTILTLNNFDTQPLNGPRHLFYSFCCTTQCTFEPLCVYEPGFNMDNTVMLFKKFLKITHLNKLELLQVLHTIYHNLNMYCATISFKLHELGSTLLCTLLTHSLFQFVDSLSRVYGLNSFKEFEASI